MVGSLGTVEAPPDFDFRLRARLANDSASSTFHYWPLVQRGLAVAAAVIVIAFGVVVIKNVDFNKQSEAIAENPPAPQQSPVVVEPAQPRPPTGSAYVATDVSTSGSNKIKNDRRNQTVPRVKPRMSTVDSAFGVAPVYPLSEAYNSEANTGFPIDASLQPLRLSLDDGRGNAKTISVPTIRFGSQRMLPNKSAEKGIW